MQFWASIDSDKWNYYVIIDDDNDYNNDKGKSD